MGGTALQLNTFEIKEFGGLVTGAPRGSATLGFRMLDGFTHKGLVGGLTIAPSRATRFNNEETISRLMVLWDEPSNNPAVYTQDSTSGVRYRANWNTAAGTALAFTPAVTSYVGKTRGDLKRIKRGKMGMVAWSKYPTDDRYPISFCTPLGDVANNVNDPFSTTPFTVTPTAGGSLAVGNYTITLIPMRKVTVGLDSWYVADYFFQPRNIIAATAGANLSLSVGWVGADAVIGVLYDQTNRNYYTLGVHTTTPFLIDAYPLEESETKNFMTEWLPLNDGFCTAYRNDRTWIAGNTYRYPGRDAFLPSVETQIQNTTATLWFTDVGRLWAFPVGNFITLSITGNITAMANLSNALLVFSRSEIWAITGNSELDFVAFKIPGGNPGCIDAQGVQEWRDAVYYVAPDGVYKVNLNGCENVSFPIRDVFLNMGANPVLSTGIDRFRNEFFLALNGALYVLDLEKNVWLTRGTANVVEGGDVVMVTNGTTVNSLDGNSNSTAVFQTEWLDMNAPEMDKFFRQIRLVVENPTSSICTITVQPIKFDGTLLTAPAPQTVGAGAKARLNFGLKGQGMVGRGLAFRVTVTGLPGAVIRPDMTIEWRALGTRGR
jgi:hypothetical protein